MTWIRNPEEVKSALFIQCLALRASCEAYDKGEWWEALRLATSVYIIVHDGGRNSQSLLKQLGLRGRMRFISTAFQYSPGNVLRETHLVATRIYGDGRAEYRPKLGDGPTEERAIQFSDWWDKELIFRDGSHRLTRKRLVFVLRSQEGGAHFDPEIRDPNYLQFAKEQLTTPRVIFGDTSRPILGAEIASMRQIAWELLESIKRGGIWDNAAQTP